jgi:hypothetical protein
MPGANIGAGTDYTFGAHEFIPGFSWGLSCAIFSFLCTVFPLFVFLLFFFGHSITCSSIYGF